MFTLKMESYKKKMYPYWYTGIFRSKLLQYAHSNECKERFNIFFFTIPFFFLVLSTNNNDVI